MSSPYKRRRPSLIRNFWVYRWMVAAAVVLGLLLGFVFINSAPVTVYFPFGLGQISSTAGVVVLLGALAGSVLTVLVGTVVLGSVVSADARPFAVASNTVSVEEMTSASRRFDRMAFPPVVTRSQVAREQYWAFPELPQFEANCTNRHLTSRSLPLRAMGSGRRH